MAVNPFEAFLDAAASVPGRRLRKRIRKELGDHMEDMLADKIEAGTDEKEAKKQVLSEMGDPAALRREFIRAHRAEIRLTRLGSILTAVILLNCFFVFALPCFKEAAVYFSADTLQEAEQKIREENGDVWSPAFRPTESALDEFYAEHMAGKSLFYAQKGNTKVLQTGACIYPRLCWI